MLPIVIDPSKLNVGLAGSGELLERRRAMLREADIEPHSLDLDATDGLAGLAVLYIAGAEIGAAKTLAMRAKARGILVNVEDNPALCDFHVPATVRQGDLLLTVSSGGRSPGLASAIREWLASRFGSEWGARTDEIAAHRTAWRAAGLKAPEIAGKTREYAAEWLA